MNFKIKIMELVLLFAAFTVISLVYSLASYITVVARHGFGKNDAKDALKR